MCWGGQETPAGRNSRICTSKSKDVVGLSIPSAPIAIIQFFCLQTYRAAMHRPPAGCRRRYGALPSTWRTTLPPTIIQRAGLTVEVPEKERAIYDGYPGAASATALALVGYTARSRARSSRPLSPDQTAISSSRSDVRSTKTGHHIFPMPVSTASRRYDHRASIVRSSPSPERHWRDLSGSNVPQRSYCDRSRTGTVFSSR